MMIREGISRGWQLKKLSLVLYGVEVALAWFISLQIMKGFDQGMGNSLDLERFLYGFDYTTMHDFLALHGDVIDLLIYQMEIFIPIFFIINIFSTAGILYCGHTGSSRWLDFWRGGSRFFYAFLINFLLYGLVMLVWSAIWLGPMIWLVPYFLESCACEKWLFTILLSMTTIYLIGMITIVNGSAFSKSMIIGRELKSNQAFFPGMRLAITRFGRSMMVFLFFILTAMLIMALYRTITRTVGMQWSLTVTLVVLLEQVLILTRVLLRMMYLYALQTGEKVFRIN